MLMVALNGAASLIGLASLMVMIGMMVSRGWQQLVRIMNEGAALSALEAAEPSLRWRLAA